MCRRDGREVYCKATTDIDIGGLQVPLTLKNMGSLAPVASQDEAKHPLAVNVDVQWQVTDVEKSMGVEQDNHIVNFKALPEFNLPKRVVTGKKLEWILTFGLSLVFAGVYFRVGADKLDKWAGCSSNSPRG